jgi:hypothetical protein
MKKELIGKKTVAILLAASLLCSSGCSMAPAVKKAAPVKPVLSQAAAESSAGTNLFTMPVQKAAVKRTTSNPPLRNDGTRCKPRRDFLLRQSRYHLLSVPTYDGSNQSTHPKLLYFPSGWNGYRYWMSITPYPETNASYENPCIVTSNDGNTWVTPKGIHNPITGIPHDVRIGGHYSDSQLVMNGKKMELWYRYNPGNRRTRQPNYTYDYYYRITSTNGVRWSAPQLIQKKYGNMMSLAICCQNGQYQFWYTNSSNRLIHAFSRDGVHWNAPSVCSIPLPAGYTPWHQDVVYYHHTYYLLQTGWYHKKYSFALFLSKSSDGIHFTRGVPFYPSSDPVVLHQTWLYRSSFIIDSHANCQMIVSLCLPKHKWFLTKCSIPLSRWDNACRTQKGITLPAAPTAKRV